MVPLFCPILVEKDRSVFLVQRMKGHMRSKCLWFALRLLHVVEEMEGKEPSVQLQRRMDTILQPIEGCQGSHKRRNTLISKFKNSRASSMFLGSRKGAHEMLSSKHSHLLLKYSTSSQPRRNLTCHTQIQPEFKSQDRSSTLYRLNDRMPIT